MWKQVLMIYIGIPLIALIICASTSSGYVEPKPAEHNNGSMTYEELSEFYNDTIDQCNNELSITR